MISRNTDIIDTGGTFDECATANSEATPNIRCRDSGAAGESNYISLKLPLHSVIYTCINFTLCNLFFFCLQF